MKIHRERYGPSFPLADHQINDFVRFIDTNGTITSGILFHICAPGSVDGSTAIFYIIQPFGHRMAVLVPPGRIVQDPTFPT